MKKRIALMLVMATVLVLFGCGALQEETAVTGETGTPTILPTEIAQPTQETLPPIPEEMVCLDEVIEGSDIQMTLEEDKILLHENGLELELSTDGVLGYRDGYVMAVLQMESIVMDGKVYVDGKVCESFLSKEGEDQPSLFHGMMFLASEILDAVQQPEASEFNRKLLAEISLPASMGIEIPHIDMSRFFYTKSLSDYPDALKAELEELGYAHAILYTYGEYVVLSEGQMMDQLLSDQARRSYPQLKHLELEKMTVGEYKKLRAEVDQQNSIDALSEEEKTFASEKGIELSDMLHLKKIFYGEYMNQSDETLKAALKEYYQADIDYLKDVAQTE